MLLLHQATTLLPFLTSAALTAAQSGSGTTTRYWDCCKPSCAWNSVTGVTKPVTSCDQDDNPLTSTSTQSGCAGGSAYMCSNQSPWAVNANLAYGFAAISANNAPSCCSCYQLTFTSDAIAGKEMIVQATNTGYDVGSTQFDIAMPGGGFGQFDACTSEWNATSAVWGAQYGGASTDTCSAFPSKLQPGCEFRWGWFQGADNPSVNYQVVTCPAEIVAKSGCSVTGYNASAKFLRSVSSKKTTSLVPRMEAATRSPTSAYESSTSTKKTATVAIVAPKAPAHPHQPYYPAKLAQNEEAEEDDNCETQAGYQSERF